MLLVPRVGTQYHDRLISFVDKDQKIILLVCPFGHRTKMTFGNWYVYRNRPRTKCKLCDYESRNKLSNAEALEMLKGYR